MTKGKFYEQIANWQWHRAAAQLAVLVIFAVCACLRVHGPEHQFAIDVLFCLHTTTWVLFIGCVGLVSGVGGRMFWLASLAVTAVMGVWLLASIELYVTQGRALQWRELLWRINDPASQDFIITCLADWRIPTIIAVAFLGGLLGAWVLSKAPSGACMLLWILSLAGIKAGATAWVYAHSAGYSANTYQAMRVVYAPWNPVRMQWQDNVMRIPNLVAAQAIREIPDESLFEVGGDPLWARLQTSYAQRPVVIISLESHRLSDVQPLGVGAWGHRDLSPNLAKWATSGISFSNVIESGQHTQSMAWAMVTGLENHPDFDGSHFGSGVARFSAIHNFTSAGYTAEWLQATPTAFADNDKVLVKAGMRSGLDASEIPREPHSRNGWGIGDVDLLRIALARIQRWNSQSQPYVLVIATVSNHYPVTVPDRVGEMILSNDFAGGMRYADFAVGEFLNAWAGLPQQVKPIVYITADHTHRDGLTQAPPCGIQGLEGLRLPGLLILPDGAEAGTRWDGMMSHADVLDLAAHLVLPAGAPGKWKFRTHRRIAVPVARGGAYSVVSATGYFDGESNKTWQISNLWKLDTTNPALDKRLRVMQESALSSIHNLWSTVDVGQ